MVLSLLYGKKYQKGQIDTIELDVTMRENHNYSSRVTNYPIEDGSTLSDHIINEPTTLNLEGIVTDSPLAIFPTFNRSVKAFNQLVDLHRKRVVIKVVSGIKVYEKMVITSLDVPREVLTGQSLRFNIQLQEVILDSTVLLQDRDIFDDRKEVINREEVSSGENIELIQNDPQNSLKDQATTGKDAGIQGTQLPSNSTLINFLQSFQTLRN